MLHPRAYIDQDSADALELARLGYKQELKRAFSPLELFCLVFGIFGLFPSITYVNLTVTRSNFTLCLLVPF